MKVFVTGASGFVGGHVVEGLRFAGHEVLGMARSDNSAVVVAARGAQPVRCDLESVQAADLAGVEVVVHAAAHVEEWGSRDDYERGNVEGTRRLLRAAEEAGVVRFIHISSNAVLQDGREVVDADESWSLPVAHRFLYAETKAAAERDVLEANGAMETVALRPCLMWGPRDTTVLPALRRMVREGGFVWLDGGTARISTTHVANLVRAVELALTEGRGGHAYYIADEEPVTVRDFLSRLAAAEGMELPERSVPASVVRPAAAALEGTWRLLGLECAPPITRLGASVLSTTHTVRTDKARTELNYRPIVGFEEGLVELAA